MNPLHLHPGRERRIPMDTGGFFSNEIASALSEYEPELGRGLLAKGVPLGSGYIIQHRSYPCDSLSGSKPDASFFREIMIKAPGTANGHIRVLSVTG